MVRWIVVELFLVWVMVDFRMFLLYGMLFMVMIFCFMVRFVLNVGLFYWIVVIFVLVMLMFSE